MILVEFDFNRIEMQENLNRENLFRKGLSRFSSNFTRKILDLLTEYRKDVSEPPIIYIGLNLSSLMLKSNAFHLIKGYGNKTFLGAKCLGNFAIYRVYLDLRINPNEVIIGNEIELSKYVLRIERQKKLQKIKNLKK